MTPSQNRRRRELLGTVSPILDCFGKRIGRIMMRFDKDFQVQRVRFYEPIEVKDTEIKNVKP